VRPLLILFVTLLFPMQALSSTFQVAKEVFLDALAFGIWNVSARRILFVGSAIAAGVGAAELMEWLKKKGKVTKVSYMPVALTVKYTCDLTGCYVPPEPYGYEVLKRRETKAEDFCLPESGRLLDVSVDRDKGVISRSWVDVEKVDCWEVGSYCSEYTEELCGSSQRYYWRAHYFEDVLVPTLPWFYDPVGKVLYVKRNKKDNFSDLSIDDFPPLSVSDFDDDVVAVDVSATTGDLVDLPLVDVAGDTSDVVDTVDVAGDTSDVVDTVDVAGDASDVIDTVDVADTSEITNTTDIVKALKDAVVTLSSDLSRIDTDVLSLKDSLEKKIADVKESVDYVAQSLQSLPKRFSEQVASEVSAVSFPSLELPELDTSLDIPEVTKNDVIAHFKPFVSFENLIHVNLDNAYCKISRTVNFWGKEQTLEIDFCRYSEYLRKLGDVLAGISGVMALFLMFGV